MEVEIRKKENCISQYNTLAEKEHINVINNQCKSKRGFTELRRESCVFWRVLLWASNRNTLCNFCQSCCQLLSLCMWQYESYCSINTRYVAVFTFTPHNIQLLLLCMWQYESYCSINICYVAVFTFTPHNIQLLSLCMWQYESYCSINTRYVPVFTFTSHNIQLLSLCMWQYDSYCSINTRYVPVFTFTSHNIQLPSTSLNNLNSTTYCYCCSTEINGQTPKPSLPLYSYITFCTGRWVKIQTV
jgi:hypothetical protein